MPSCIRSQVFSNIYNTSAEYDNFLLIYSILFSEKGSAWEDVLMTTEQILHYPTHPEWSIER